MFKLNKWLIISLLSCCDLYIFASPTHSLTIEELRIEKASHTMPDVVDRLQKHITQTRLLLSKAKTFSMLSNTIEQQAHSLWKTALISYAEHTDFDDRPLYWARLQMSRQLRKNDLFQQLASAQQENLLWQLELLTRGQNDVTFDKKTNKKVLLTGFDPFFLDRNIEQSNPSGTVALALDNLVINNGNQSVEIESLIVPVRFADFDKGMIEQLLTPWLKEKQIDMIITVSMGRDDFDLERFPGLRRSAKAPDNLNVFTGATAEHPQIPLLNGKPLQGPEFIEFSLPASKMQKASGNFTVNDNRKVTTTEKKFSPDNVAQLSQQISVQGSGGGYLSNEISYRSLLLRDKYNKNLAVGHVHTPRFKGFKPKKTEQIIEQIKNMITMTLTEK